MTEIIGQMPDSEMEPSGGIERRTADSAASIHAPIAPPEGPAYIKPAHTKKGLQKP